MHHRPVRKAILPVAGLGTRLLPATKAMPKEMLTIVDRPLIQYAVEEAFAAGIEQVIFVSAQGKSVLEDHFDRAFQLEETLKARGKSLAALASTQIPQGRIVSVRQQVPLGLGHAVWSAHPLIGDEPFAVLLPDDLIHGEPGCLSEMMAAYQHHGGNVVAVQTVPEDQTHKYGMVTPGDGPAGDSITPVAGLVEKPAPGTAPSRLAVVGRYILQPEVMALLARHETGQGGEIQLTDAMAKLIGTQPFHAVAFTGTRYDCGDKAGFVMANFALALATADLGPDLARFAQEQLDARAP